MNKAQYDGSEQFTPITPWGYVGYTILFAIPIIGIILLIVFSISSKNINRRNYARSFWCVFLIALILFILCVALSYFNIGNINETIEKWNITPLSETINTIEDLLPKRDASATNQQRISATPTPKPSAKQNQTNGTNSNAGVRANVKEAIDSYEDFFKQYVSFMKKYAQSTNPLSMMAEYTSMMIKYTETMQKFESFDEDNDLNAAEVLYYTEAVTRIEKMLLDIN